MLGPLIAIPVNGCILFGGLYFYFVVVLVINMIARKVVGFSCVYLINGDNDNLPYLSLGPGNSK